MYASLQNPSNTVSVLLKNPHAYSKNEMQIPRVAEMENHTNLTSACVFLLFFMPHAKSGDTQEEQQLHATQSRFVSSDRSSSSLTLHLVCQAVKPHTERHNRLDVRSLCCFSVTLCALSFRVQRNKNIIPRQRQSHAVLSRLTSETPNVPRALHEEKLDI